MKICLINSSAPKPGWKSVQPQLGLLYIAAYLEKHGHEVYFWDREYDAELSVKAKIEKVRPDIVGITAVTSTVVDAFDVAEKIKRNFPDIPIVFGGVHATALPERSMKECPSIDILVVGEGEDTFLEIVEAVASRKGFGGINGIFYREDGRVAPTAPRGLETNIDKYPHPNRKHLDRDRYFVPSDSAVRGVFLVSSTLITSRGCPFDCSFCAAPVMTKRRVRYHSPEYVIEEVERLHKDFGVEGLFITDDMFMAKKSRAQAICRKFIEKGFHKKIKWSAQLRVDSFDEETLKLMKEAGCVQVEFGFESGSQRILDFLNKNTTVEQNIRVGKAAKEMGFKLLANVLLGIPGETEEDIQKTINMIREIKPDFVSPNLIIPLPGTGIWEMANKNGWLVSDNWATYRQDPTGMPTLKDENRTIMEIDEVYRRFLRDVSNKINARSRLKTMIRHHPMMIPREILRVFNKVYSTAKG